MAELSQTRGISVLFRVSGLPDHGGVSGTSPHTGPSRHTPSLEAAILAIAARQHDLVTHRQLLAVGLPRQAVARRVARGALHPRHRGVYSLGPAPLSREAQFLAAVLGAGEGSALAGLSLAELRGCIRYRARLIAVVSPRLRTLVGVQIHRYRSIDPRDLTTFHGIPVTTVARMLVDLTDVLTPQELANVIHEAAFRGLFSELATRDAMARANGRHKLHVLEEALAIHAAGGAGFRSKAERAFHALIRPEEPLVNTKLLGEEVDCRWPREQLVVEIDGPGHARPRARRDDANRDRRLRAAGYTVLRFTDKDVYERPEAVRQRTAAVLASIRAARRAA